ncbi:MULTISPECIES: DNA mismatch repair protein MutS [Muribaculum]|jgi:DNA mismatch repair protein MutS|uniref:DNA mismatch repair protein MutS n=1 Tax=Muribaculum caecicola TaxID=3038144 RepID=A0AC61S5Y1_9BACT|nr:MULTISPECIES: DNA mismatch repair protein MutS [Muribaculum]THG51976.1 DNA mismatch repair protein MutS [Muribaculum caecicola]
MKQYVEMKAKHPDAILLFRVGDFYETFSDDAIQASEILGITLTRRANGSAQYVELAGFPHHALDSYLPKLVRAGKRVAICEQLEDPKLTKKLVKRGITELVTPGVAVTDTVLNHRENNFLAAVYFGQRGAVGVSFLDISTGEFLAAEGNADYVDKLMDKFAPKEVLVERGRRRLLDETFSAAYLSFELDDWIFTADAARERLLKQFGTTSLKGFGITAMPSAVIAAGAAMHYLDITNHTQTAHITKLARIEEENYVRLDKFTVRNLELVNPLGEEGRSLLDILDTTVTPMGARMMRRWLLFPLKDTEAINARLDAVEQLMRDTGTRNAVTARLEGVGDMERIISKVAVGRVSPRELVFLRDSLAAVADLRQMCSGHESLTTIAEQLNPCTQLRERIEHEIVDDAPVAVNRGQVIKPGVDAELDELREIAFQGKDYLLRLQQRESETTGIGSLKIGYNNVFGYYIEVTNTHRDKVPPQWIRKQTLVNAERYITEELKQYEEKILTAQERIEIIENRLFAALVAAVSDYIQAIQLDATLIGRLDVLTSFARVSLANHYNRPVVDNSLELSLCEARHPVIERQLPESDPYIANSVTLNNESAQILMITGPNMSGKSALLRQTALNVIMAQTGCFVAADSAHIGIVDKVFTRVGASDNISLGESTFMVEMNEAASILNNMSRRSLILFDELGRGTSTYDGISIAWAIVEHIHNHNGIHPKTLFATHYHELNDMEAGFDRVKNYNVSVREINGKVVFLRKLSRGGSEHSFGIHVAKLAGMPPEIVARATEVLHRLESINSRETAETDEQAAKAARPDTHKLLQTENSPGMQLSFFQLDDPVLQQVRDEILNLDINNLTPMAALNKLHDIRIIITGK